MFEINTEELYSALVKDIKAGLTPMVTSSPGMGKSDIIRQIAEDFNLKLLDLRVSQCEPVDMQGFPAVNAQSRMTFHVPEYFPLAGQDTPPVKEKYIGKTEVELQAYQSRGEVTHYVGWLLFLDEFNSGNKSTEAAAYKLILDREVYKHKLHPHCAIVAAGNLTTDRAIVNNMSTGTTSRLIHYKLMIDHNLWLDWANTHNIDHRIISFIKFKPAILHRFDPATSELTFPCPRTWFFASQIIKDMPTIDNLTKIRLAGTVGEGAAVEFGAFAEIYTELPTIDQILQDPKKGWTVPGEPSAQYAITTLLSHNMSEKTIDKLVLAIDRLPAEFQVTTWQETVKRLPELKHHSAYQNWLINNAAKLY